MNDDGFISVEELRAIFQGETLEKDSKFYDSWDIIMKEIDLDDNGVISYEEFHSKIMQVMHETHYWIDSIFNFFVNWLEFL